LLKVPKMKFDKDLFLVNMNMVELEGKKVMVRPSQAETTKGKEVVIGDERQPRMIKPKSLEVGQWKKMRGASHNLAQMPLLTSSWLCIGKAGLILGRMKTRPSSFPNQTF
jgi:hypothetical protein